MSTRPAAVAGYFYEADPRRLRRDIDELLDAAQPQYPHSPSALIVPHAGYVYSGLTAAHGYRCLRGAADRLRRVLLLGPAHRLYVVGMALPSHDRFATPLGDVPLDRAALDELAGMDSVETSDEAHREEHCLEVQLPFLQRVLHEFTLLPVLVGGADADDVATLIDRFAADPETLVVVSSDLSHFHSAREARRIDSDTCNRILARSTRLSGEQACGARAVNGLMASKAGSEREISLLHACNSADTAGNPGRVVGYAAFALH